MASATQATIAILQPSRLRYFPHINAKNLYSYFGTIDFYFYDVRMMSECKGPFQSVMFFFSSLSKKKNLFSKVLWLNLRFI